MPDSLMPTPARRILVLDDDEVLVRILTEVLQNNSCTVTATTRGVDALRKIVAEDYDAVICDMVMPELSGQMFYMAVQRVRPELCKRFIFITAHRADKAVDEFVKKQKCLLIWKPFELHVLVDAIQVVIKKNAQVQS